MNQFHRINVEQAQEIIRSKNVTIVDIRDPSSHQSSHIENAVLINDENIKEFLEKTPKENPLICYCYHGFSSQNAAQFFLENGFQEVYSLDGGFEAWSSNLSGNK